MEPLSLHRRVDLDVSAEALWELITDPEHLAAWLGDGVHLDVTPGGTGAVIDDGVHRVVHVDRVEPGRTLAFTWWEDGEAALPSGVQFDIAARPDGGSRLEITETLSAAAGTRAGALAERAVRWEARVCALWACTVVAALVP